jgi:hypothetical protein
VDPALSVLRHYFAEELKESWVFLLVGLLALGLGVWLWRTQSAFKHALWPLAAVAIIQLAVGGAVVARTPSQVIGLEQGLQRDPKGTRDAEVARLLKVLDAFRFVKLAEIAVLAIALGLALFVPHHAVGRGVALGLLLQASLMLAASLVAEHRAETYLDVLRRL